MIVAFTGKARHGKSTCAEYLVENYGFIKMNFKDALVQEIRDNFPDTLEKMCQEFGEFKGKKWTVDMLFAEKPPIMRALLQNYGSEVRRGDNINYWVNKWSKEVVKLLDEGKDIVVDDCRFINEANAVRTHGGRVVKVVCTDRESKETHVSETEMDKIKVDETISCKFGEIECLYDGVAQFVYNAE